MFIQLAVVVFLFLARVRFPKSKSIAEVIRSSYSENTVTRIRKLEKLQVLCECDDSNVIPNCLIFLLTSSRPKYSST